MRTTRILLGSLAGFLLVEILLFNTNFYTSILSPDSSTGLLELYLHNEMRRSVEDRNQVLTIGDSRMGFLPRYANEMKAETGYTFASIATAGTTPRCWYYMLRAADPTARRYAAIIIPVEDYDDVETWEDHADRLMDLHYVIPLLRWSDLAEFSGSYHDPSLKSQVARGILLKGLVYKADFLDFLHSPVARIQYATLARNESAGWYYGYVGTTDDVKAVTIDWSKRTVSARTPAEASDFEGQFLGKRPPTTGRRSAYLKRWLGKICGLYRNSGTRVIFIRLPRGPFIRPDQPQFNRHSSVRELAALPEVILDQEHFFDSLEHPEMFKDPYHFNAPGAAEFSRMLTRHVRDLLATRKLWGSLQSCAAVADRRSRRVSQTRRRISSCPTGNAL